MQQTTNKKKIIGIIGIILTFFHMTYFALHPYSFLAFMTGFGVIYLVFVLGIRKIQ